MSYFEYRKGVKRVDKEKQDHAELMKIWHERGKHHAIQLKEAVITDKTS